jgi:hypothetical protein
MLTGFRLKSQQPMPLVRLLERLHKRNEFLISSHHPLQETLISQTGGVIALRRGFLSNFHDSALATLLQTWESEEVSSALF